MKVTRLRSGGFMSSGTDAGDLNILRTAKNIDDSSGMSAGGALKSKVKKVISGLKKASKTSVRSFCLINSLVAYIKNFKDRFGCDFIYSKSSLLLILYL